MTELKNFGLLHLSSARQWRGGEQQLFYLFRELEKLSVRQWVFLPEGVAFEKMEKSGLKPLRLLHRQPWTMVDAFRLSRFCRKNRIDVIHAHDAKSHSLAVLCCSIFGCRAKVVAHRRVDNPIKNGKLTRWKYDHPSVKAVICVSKKIKSIAANYLKKPDKAVVIYSAVDLPKQPEGDQEGSLRELLGVKTTDRLIGNISAVDDHKDPLTFIKAAAQLLKKRGDLTFVWIGGGNSAKFKEVQDAVRDLKLEDRIYFPGYIEGAKKHLGEFDVFLFTSSSEGLGTTLLDALARKVPVVATDAGGVGELIDHGKTGYLAPVKDTEKLTEGVLLLLKGREWREKVTLEGFRRVSESFLPELMAQKTLELYVEVLQGDS